MVNQYVSDDLFRWLIILLYGNIDLTAKQFEYALLMKFLLSRPSLHDIKLHIKLNWKLALDHVVSLIDSLHVLIIPTSHWIWFWHKFMSLIYSYFVISSRWTKNWEYGKDSTLVTIWVKLPHLHFLYFHLAYI